MSRRRPLTTLACGSALVLVAALTQLPSGAVPVPGTLPPPASPCAADPADYAGLTPDQVGALYGLDELTARGSTGGGQRIALLELGGQVPDMDRVQHWYGCFDVDVDVVHQVVIGDGPTSSLSEATGDVILAGLAAPGLDGIHVITVTGTNTPEKFEVALRAALEPANTGGELVDAISMSYGHCASEFDVAEVAGVEAVLSDAATLGVDVVFAAGDSGTACGPHPITAAEAADPAHQGVSYPGSSAQVVAVGGTMLDGVQDPTTGAWTVAEEVVWYERLVHVPSKPGCTDATPCAFAGGGGASRTIAAPPWQVDLGLDPSARHTPDVAMMAGGPGYALGGLQGTSMAAPLIAAGWLAVRSDLEAAGAPDPGPLLPLLYRMASERTDVLRDIVTGSNDPLGVLGCCDAVPGYDQASGLGSVDFGALAGALRAEAPATTTTTATSAPPTPAAPTTAGSAAPATTATAAAPVTARPTLTG